ncbi:MAG: prepilin-type N-terminal cleavage/methylation domain-containing protein [bacterium]|nr:prepilin-type N-terminal cleavage/methylation domain-containing protein [bacterium]
MKLQNQNGNCLFLRGFTLIELAVVISIIAIVVAIAVPQVGNSIQKSREAALKKNLQVFRKTIDRFFADFKRYPASLEELVEKRYLRAIPVDPLTKSTDTWEIIHSEAGTDDVFDIKSGSDKLSSDETPYSEW